MAELAGRDARERQFARTLGKLSARHKRELAGLLGDPPDASRVPNEFWERVRKETENELVALLLLIYLAAATQHGLDLQAAEPLGLQFATGRAAETARGWVNHGREMLAAGIPDDARLIQIFGPERISVLSITEVTRAMRAGSDVIVERARSAGMLVTRIWRHTSYRPRRHSGSDVEPCPYCTPREGLTDEERADAGLPGEIGDHPNCDCYWEYVDLGTGDILDPDSF